MAPLVTEKYICTSAVRQARVRLLRTLIPPTVSQECGETAATGTGEAPLPSIETNDVGDALPAVPPAGASGAYGEEEEPEEQELAEEELTLGTAVPGRMRAKSTGSTNLLDGGSCKSKHRNVVANSACPAPMYAVTAYLAERPATSDSDQPGYQFVFKWTVPKAAVHQGHTHVISVKPAPDNVLSQRFPLLASVQFLKIVSACSCDCAFGNVLVSGVFTSCCRRAGWCS